MLVHIQSCSRTVIESCSRTLISSCSHAVVRPYSRTVVHSYTHTAVGFSQAPAPHLLVWACTFFWGGVQRMCENMLHSARRLRRDWEPQVEAFRVVVRGLTASVRGSHGSEGGQGPDRETWERAMQVPLALAHFVAAIRPLFALLCRVRARLATESARPCRHEKRPPPAPPHPRGVLALSSLAPCVCARQQHYRPLAVRSRVVCATLPVAAAAAVRWPLRRGAFVRLRVAPACLRVSPPLSAPRARARGSS